MQHLSSYWCLKGRYSKLYPNILCDYSVLRSIVCTFQIIIPNFVSTVYVFVDSKICAVNNANINKSKIRGVLNE